jgi:hypothetical protein
MDHVHHDPRPAPDGDRLALINREIAALFDGAGDEPLDPVRLARYHVLRDRYVKARYGDGARGREGEDDEAQAA